jgi:hypothetical protein
VSRDVNTPRVPRGLANVELERLTGDPIVPGRLIIGSVDDMDAMDFPAHDKILISFYSPLLSTISHAAIFPVMNAVRDEEDFFHVTKDLGLVLDSLTPEHITTLSRPGQGSRSFIRSGEHTGRLVMRRPMESGSELWLDTQCGCVQSYQITAEHVPEGLDISIQGTFGGFDENQTSAIPEIDLSGKEFRLAATIPRETWQLKGFGSLIPSFPLGHKRIGGP